MKGFQVIFGLLISPVLSLDVSKQQIFEEIQNSDELTAWKEDFPHNEHQLPPKYLMNSMVQSFQVPQTKGSQNTGYSPDELAAWNEDFPSNKHQLPPKDFMNSLLQSVLLPQVGGHQYSGYNPDSVSINSYKGYQIPTGNVISVQPPASYQASLNQWINRGLPPQVDSYKGLQENYEDLASSGVKVAHFNQAQPISRTTIFNQLGSTGQVGKAVPFLNTGGQLGMNIAQSVSAQSYPFAQIAQVGNLNEMKVAIQCRSTFWNTADCNTCYCNSGHPVCIPISCEEQSCPMTQECAAVKGFCVKSGTKCHGLLEPSLCGDNTCTCCIPQAGKFALP